MQGINSEAETNAWTPIDGPTIVGRPVKHTAKSFLQVIRVTIGMDDTREST